ncbi:MAG: hypothetical protein AAFN74_15745 [Myxococcota bacterium]
MSTLHPRMFIAQRTLEAWLETGNVQVDNTVVILENLGRSYDLTPAVRFIKVLPEGAAPDIVGKVLTEERITELGGELMGGSVLFGETAFEVEPGFVGRLRDAGS